MDQWNRNRTLQPAAGLQRDVKDGAKDDAKDRDAKRRDREARRHARLDDELERGLEDTFPGSDPVSVTQPAHSVHDKNAAQKH